MPAIEAHKKRQDRLSEELLEGFKDLKAFLKWKHELIHACLGWEESIEKVINILPRFSWPMFIGTEPNKERYRLEIYNYLMSQVFGPTESVLFHRAKEDSSGKGGMRREEENLFGGGT